jgi:hypothetical protein
MIRNISRIRTMSPIRNGILLAASLLLLSACASTPAIDTSRPIDPREVMQRVEQRGSEILALRGSGKLSVESPEFSGGGSIQVRLLKPDSLQLEITGPFGVTVARGLVTDRDFQFYDGMNHTVAEGATNPQNLRRVLRFPITFDDILSVLTGSLGFGAAPQDAEPQGRLEGGDYILTWESEGETLEYTIDTATLAVRRFTRRGTDGLIREEILFRDFRKHSGIEVPHIVSFSRPTDQESLSIIYDRLTVNDLPMVFNFSYPKSARRISL